MATGRSFAVKKEDRKISIAETVKEATKKARKNMKKVFRFDFKDILKFSPLIMIYADESSFAGF